MKLRKKIYLVYQDFAMCGSRKNWGDVQLKVADKLRYEIVKKPMYKKDTKELVKDAVFKHGIGYLPFFTDGEGHYGRTVAQLDEVLKAAKEAEKPKKTRKTRKTKKGKQNGSSSNAE